MKSFFSVLVLFLCANFQAQATEAPPIKSVIFFHPDGMSAATWGAVRISTVGPDGRTEWDQLPGMAVYTGHMKDSLAATSNGGATTHAYGVKVAASSFGLDAGKEITAASGKKMSILREAQKAGRMTALVQSGSITEPGTAAFVAQVKNREDHFEIAKQVLMSGVDVILSGGEKYLLPLNIKGRFGPGTRTDNLNLISEAEKMGYKVVYTAKELKALSKDVKKVFGVFAYDHTFFDQTEEELKANKLPLYLQTAPSISEMTDAALKILKNHPKGFFAVIEEEGSDNFANKNNAKGALEAGRRADQTIGVIRKFIEVYNNTLMIMASDSDAGALALHGPTTDRLKANEPVPEKDMNGNLIDGRDGAKTLPFIAPADKAGKKWPYTITWGSLSDVSGGILVRGMGVNSDQIKGTFDNTDIYKLMHKTLF